MTTEIIKLTATELKPFSLEFLTKAPELTDKVDWLERCGTVKIKGEELKCQSNDLIIIVDFDIDYNITHSTGDYWTPSYTDIDYHTPIVCDWKATDVEGNEVELDRDAEINLGLSLIDLLKFTYR